VLFTRTFRLVLLLSMRVSFIFLLATIIALVSLAYPSINVSTASTHTLPTFMIYTSGYTEGYPQLSSTFVLAYSFVSTEWYPGNGLCDPASMACTPQPMPTATTTFTQWSAYFYQVTVYSQISTTYTNQSVVVSTETSYQPVAPYAIAGLNEFQYGLSAMLIVAAIIVLIMIFYAKGNVRTRPTILTPVVESMKPRSYCTQCGTENLASSETCIKCGVKLE